MTREEAIMKWIIPACKRMWNEKKCNEIFEALEQEQFDERKKMFAYLDGVADGLNNPLVESCEDVVSREKALDIVNDYYTMRDITRHEEDNLHEIMEKIENLPSVYPKQKTGH